MKFRRDFVTNSSSSSFVCELCGRTESGWDMVLRDAEMVECVNGHTICVNEMLTPPRELMIQLIREEMESSWSNIEYLTDEELNEKTDEELEDLMLEREDGYYCVPEECCPICQFIEYSNLTSTQPKLCPASKIGLVHTDISETISIRGEI